MISGHEIRRAVRRHAKRFEKRHNSACHVACCMATDGHVHMVLATRSRLVEARNLIIGWAGYRVPIESCELQLSVIDRKLRE